MRTLIFLLCLAGYIPSSAQQTDSTLWKKAAKSYQNLVRYILADQLSNKAIFDHAINLASLVEVDDNGLEYELGVVGARRLIFAMIIRESVADINVTGDYSERGLLQISPVNLEDHYKRNPRYKKYTLEDLAKPENVTVSLDILNSCIAHKPYKLNSKERLLRAWNGGPDGWTEFGTKGEDPEHHERELQRTWNYYLEVLEIEKIVTYLEERGIAHSLWSYPTDGKKYDLTLKPLF